MSTPPGALTPTSPGQTDRVAEIVARTAALARQSELSNYEPADLAVGAASDLTAEQARQLTEEIKTGAEALWDNVVRAYTERAWDVLGYDSWNSYCTAEFGSLRLRLPLEERQDVVCSLREAGLSIRAIASGVGISDQTVQRDLKAAVVNHYTSPEESAGPTDVEAVEDHGVDRKVTGIDGKTHPRHKPTPKLPTPARRGGYTSELTPVRKALREVLDNVVRFDQLADDEQFCTWFVEKDSRVADVRREIAKAIEQLQRMDERVEQMVVATLNSGAR